MASVKGAKKTGKRPERKRPERAVPVKDVAIIVRLSSDQRNRFNRAIGLAFKLYGEGTVQTAAGVIRENIQEYCRRVESAAEAEKRGGK